MRFLSRLFSWLRHAKQVVVDEHDVKICYRSTHCIAGVDPMEYAEVAIKAIAAEVSDKMLHTFDPDIYEVCNRGLYSSQYQTFGSTGHFIHGSASSEERFAMSCRVLGNVIGHHAKDNLLNFAPVPNEYQYYWGANSSGIIVEYKGIVLRCVVARPLNSESLTIQVSVQVRQIAKRPTPAVYYSQPKRRLIGEPSRLPKHLQHKKRKLRFYVTD